MDSLGHERPIINLILSLKDSDPFVRAEALDTLDAIQPEWRTSQAARDSIPGILQSVRPFSRELQPAAVLLRDIGDSSAVSGLVECLGKIGDDPVGSPQIVSALDRIDPDWRRLEVTATVASQLIVELKNVREIWQFPRIVSALRILRAPQALQPLVQLLQGKSLRERFLDVWRRITGKPPGPNWSQDDNVASIIVDALGELGNVDALSAILPLVHGAEKVRRATVRALGKLRDNRVYDPLAVAVREMPVEAADALGTLGDSRAVALLTDALRDPSIPNEGRLAVAETLCRLGNESGVRHFVATLSDADSYQRERAATVLGKVCDTSAAAPVKEIAVAAVRDYNAATVPKMVLLLASPMNDEAMYYQQMDAARVLQRIGRDAQPAVTTLLDILQRISSNANRTVREGELGESIALALLAIGETSSLVPILQTWLFSHVGSNRRIIWMLARIGAPAVPALSAYLDRFGSGVFDEGDLMHALGSIGSDAAGSVPAIEAELRRTSSVTIRAAGERALRQIRLKRKKLPDSSGGC